uniref:EB domain-containing protein n=1 Tax=Heterorhabditis bacteriophora TaxID=37862 RepID=A0A1I7XEZ4_HETBA
MVPPLASCNEPCPQYSACSSGIGCCPVPVKHQQLQNIQITLCPGSFSPPIGTCGSCPLGTLCNQQINMCCPSSNQPSTDLVYNVVLLCPSKIIMLISKLQMVPLQTSPVQVAALLVCILESTLCVILQYLSMKNINLYENISDFPVVQLDMYAKFSLLGGCCLLFMEPVCPSHSNAVCQCSPNNACPTGASCTLGTCCSSVFFNVAAVRKCLANATDLNFDVDSTCLPNEKCIDGECRMKLWPGEYGCATDRECTARCLNTYCEKKRSDKNVAQCQCRDGLLLYGRCCQFLFLLINFYIDLPLILKSVFVYIRSHLQLIFFGLKTLSQCPRGFHESGAYCMHDDEDTFWSDASAQDNLNALLNAGQC